MGMALSGLASGFDWKSMVDQLIEVSRTPQKRMQSDQSKNNSKASAINEIKGLLADLKTNIASLGSQDALRKRSATLGGAATGWTGSAATTASAGKYTFSLNTLASAAKLNGKTGMLPGDSRLAASIDPGLPLSSQPLGRAITGGNFTINGKAVTIASSDTLDNVIANINASGAGVTASYDSGTDRVSLDGGGSRVVLGASNDTSNFLLAMRLSSGTNPTSAASLGSIKLSGPIDSANLANPPAAGTSSTFLINGTSISYDTSADSLQTLITRINDSAAGVTASLDASAGRFVLTNDTTGNTGIFVSEDTGGLAGSLGLIGGTLVDGTDAEFQVNGGGILASRTNTLDADAHGITGLTVTASSLGTDVVTVAADSSATKASIDSFVEKYNAVQAAIEKYTKVTTVGSKVTAGILSSNRELSQISKSLREMIYKEGSGVSGSIKRLSDIGVGFSGIANTISVTNATLLSSKLAESGSDVFSYFNTKSGGTIPSGGLIERMDYLLGNLVEDSGTAKGSIKNTLDSITSQNKSLDAQIAAIDRQLEAQRATMEASYIAMEKAQSMYQQQSSYLTKTFSGNSN
jgi:flagellar hook-associated protein 2